MAASDRGVSETECQSSLTACRLRFVDVYIHCAYGTVVEHSWHSMLRRIFVKVFKEAGQLVIVHAEFVSSASNAQLCPLFFFGRSIN